MSKMAKMVYHGTIEPKAINILDIGFWNSTKPTEWLGMGVYFFDKCKDAETWAQKESQKRAGQLPAVLETTLKYNSLDFFDLDYLPNMEKFQEEMNVVLNEIGKNGEGAVDFSGKSDSEKRSKIRCFCCNYYKCEHNIKIMAYSFPAIHFNLVGFSFCTKQRQYCVSDKTCIDNIVLKEAVDYAI